MAEIVVKYRIMGSTFMFISERERERIRERQREKERWREREERERFHDLFLKINSLTKCPRRFVHFHTGSCYRKMDINSWTYSSKLHIVTIGHVVYHETIVVLDMGF